MRKKLKKYSPGGVAPGGSFIGTLLDNLGAVPVDGAVTGNSILGGNIDPSMIASLSMRQFANANVPPNLMGDYRRGSAGALMNHGVPGQFNFMNQFMANNNLPAAPPPINTDPFQFMPQVGLQNQMDAADQALQPTGPINTAGPQVGMPANPNVNMATAPTIAPPTVTSAAYGNFAKTGLAPTMDMQPFIDANTPANSGTTGGSGMGQANVEESLGQAIFGEANEFDQAKAAINKAKGTVGTLKKIIGEDTFKSHGAKLLSKIPGKVGEKIGEKVAASAVEGAGTKFGSFLGSGAGAAASLGVGLLGKGIQELDKKDGNYSRLGAMGGGALQGAALGSMLGPVGTVAGGLIGAGIGEIQRSKFENNAKAEELTEKTILAKDNARTRLQSKQILANVPTQGIKDQIYEDGGPAGGDETIDSSPFPNMLPYSVLGPMAPLGYLFNQGLNKFKDNLGANVVPFSYGKSPEESIARFFKAGFGTPELGSRGYYEEQGSSGDNYNLSVTPNYLERQALFNMMLGNEELSNSFSVSDIIPVSNYRPTNATDENAVYYASPVTERDLIHDITMGDQDPLAAIDSLASAGPDYHNTFENVLGSYTINKGEDEQGPYLSYYDKWDLNPISSRQLNWRSSITRPIEDGIQALMGIKPAEIYGRIYYDPETGKMKPNYRVREDGGKVPARERYIPEGDEITLDMISKYMTDTRSTADDPYDFSAAADTIAYHESALGMDAAMHQIGGGPGRGIFQYDAPSADAASNRLRDLAEVWGKPNPEWNTQDNVRDFSTLSVEQQKMLWLADKLMDDTVDLAALGMREEPLKDFWADHHWRGEDKDRETRQLSFESHRLPLKVFGLPDYKDQPDKPAFKPDAKPDAMPEMSLPYNPLIFGVLPTAPKPYQADTLKISFAEGGKTNPSSIDNLLNYLSTAKSTGQQRQAATQEEYNASLKDYDEALKYHLSTLGDAALSDNYQFYTDGSQHPIDLLKPTRYSDLDLKTLGVNSEEEIWTHDNLEKKRASYKPGVIEFLSHAPTREEFENSAVYSMEGWDEKDHAHWGRMLDMFKDLGLSEDNVMYAVASPRVVPPRGSKVKATHSWNSQEGVHPYYPAPISPLLPPPDPRAVTPATPATPQRPAVDIPEKLEPRGVGTSQVPELKLKEASIPKGIKLVSEDPIRFDPMEAARKAGFRGGYDDGIYDIGVKRIYENPDGTRQVKTEMFDEEHREINRVNALDPNRFKESASFALGGGTPGGDDDQGPSITPDDPRFDQSKAYAEAMYRLRNPYADLNLPPSGRVDYTFGPIDTMLGIIPFARLAGTLGKRAVTQGVKKFVDGRNVGFPLGKYGKREAVQGIRREAPLLGFEQLFGLNLMGTDAAQDYPLKEYKERRDQGPMFEPAPYGYGGNTDKFDYIAEGGEVIVHKPGDVPDTDQNGYLTPLGPNVKMINGDKHSAPSGGVKMGQDESAFIYSDKLKVSKEMQKKIYGSNGKLRF